MIFQIEINKKHNETSVIERKQSHKLWIINTAYIRGFTCVLNFAISWIQCPHIEINNNNCVNFNTSRSQCVSLTENVLHKNYIIKPNDSQVGFVESFCMKINKANLRELIDVTSLVIFFKLYSNHWLFSPHDLEIWWMTSKNNRAPRLGYIHLCALFQSHQWIQTGVTIL